MTDTAEILAALQRAATDAMDDGLGGDALNSSCCGECAARMEGIAEDTVRAVLAELDRLGWQCLPKVPTDAMTDAWGYVDWGDSGSMASCKADWDAMLAAAPKLVEPQP